MGTLRAGQTKVPAFQLFDPLKRFDAGRRPAPKSIPRIRSLNPDWISPAGRRAPEPTPKPEPSPDDPVPAIELCRRLRALRHALDDIPGHARRLARWKARRDLALKNNRRLRPQRISPMRPGWPPGRRKRPIRDVDEVLTECHRLALYAEANPDTS